MDSVKVIFRPANIAAVARPGETILDVATRSGVEIANLCGGEGVCGKCRVRIDEGKIDVSPKDIGLLEKKEIDEGFVLACRSQIPETDIAVWVPDESDAEGEQILTTDHILNYEAPAPVAGVEDTGAPTPRHPLCRKYFLELPPPSGTDNLSDLDRIHRELRKTPEGSGAKFHYSCLWGLSGMLRRSDWKATVSVHDRDGRKPSVRLIEPGDTTGENFGVALDIGTTTVAAQLIDLRTGIVAGTAGSRNLQAKYGEDVVSRMIYACGRAGLTPLSDAVVGTVNALIDSLTTEAGIPHTHIRSVVAAGNTTMTHLLLGLEPCAIRLEPYIPVATRFPPYPAAELELKVHPKALIHCMPCVGSYVGGDISAGVLASGLGDRPEIHALIDIGTNGEIVVGNDDWMVCCSASAGPAFEGGGVRCGMRATRGAIEKVEVSAESVRIGTIGGGKPKGVCGSGIIDTLSELVTAGIIDQSGRFIDFDHPCVRVTDEVPELVLAGEDETETGSSVVVTEDDIANIVKTKGAILAAVKVLLESIGMSFNDLDGVDVAGGFGAHLDIEKAVRIGLLPDIPRERIRFIGNSSLAGARMALLSGRALRKAVEIARGMTYFELSTHPDYMNEFVASLFLPHTQMELFPSFTKAVERRRQELAGTRSS